MCIRDSCIRENDFLAGKSRIGRNLWNQNRPTFGNCSASHPKLFAEEPFAEFENQPHRRLGTVSYTHLDVYKRQAINRKIFKVAQKNSNDKSDFGTAPKS